MVVEYYMSKTEQDQSMKCKSLEYLQSAKGKKRWGGRSWIETKRTAATQLSRWI